MNYITNPSVMTAEKQRNMIFSLKRAYPFLNVQLIGKSLCQRGIFCMSIGRSENPLLITAGYHGQEWLTSLAALRFAELLLMAKSRGLTLWDTSIACISREVIIVPCVNPDGVEIAVNGIDGAGRFAQSVSKIQAESTEKWIANARGVVINLNFDAGWQELRAMEIDSGILGPSPRRYGSYAPVSEPETAAIVDLCKMRKPRMALALHSQGEEIFWEYGEKRPKRSLELARIFSAASGYELVENDGLASHGGFKDWFIDFFNKPAFTIEMGKGENPLPLTDFDSIMEHLLPILTLASML